MAYIYTATGGRQLIAGQSCSCSKSIAQSKSQKVFVAIKVIHYLADGSSHTACPGFRIKSRSFYVILKRRGWPISLAYSSSHL